MQAVGTTGALHSLANETTGKAHTASRRQFSIPLRRVLYFLCESNQFHLNSYFFLPFLIAFHFHSRFSYWMNQKDFFPSMRVSEDKKMGFFPDLGDGADQTSVGIVSGLQRREKKKPVQLMKGTGVKSPFSGVKVQIVCEKVGYTFVIQCGGLSNSLKNNALNKRFHLPTWYIGTDTERKNE